MTRTVEELREDVLLASIADAQGSIRANDAKCSAALVVHGLLFAGALSIVARIGPVYLAASGWQRIAGIALVLVAAVAFLVSVYHLLLALRPYRAPDLDVVDTLSPGVFFPLASDLGDTAGAWTRMRWRVESLGFDNVVTELARERAKLTYILQYESDHAQSGYRALFCEVAAVVVLLLYVAALAAIQAQ